MTGRARLQNAPGVDRTRGVFKGVLPADERNVGTKVSFGAGVRYPYIRRHMTRNIILRYCSSPPRYELDRWS